MDGVLLHKLFQLIEEERQDKKLLKLLEQTVSTISISNSNIIIIEFNSGESCKIFSNLSDYCIDISDPLLYQNGNNKDSKMSIDRVMYYLNILGNFKYE